MIPAGTRVYFAIRPADLRRSFDGLAALAAGELEKDPTSGGLFVFTNRRGTQVRVLFRDPRGWCLLSKRLDQGRFRVPGAEGGAIVKEADGAALLAFLDDIEVTRRARRTVRRVERKLRIVPDPAR